MAPTIEEAFRLFSQLHGLIQLGILLSGLGFASFTITHQLSSRFECVEKPDITRYMRLHRQFYDYWLTPIGKQVIDERRNPQTNRLIFHATIGVVLIVLSVAVYLVMSGVVIGTAIMSYHTMGFVPELSSTIRLLTAVVVLFVSSTMFYTWERAGEAVSNA